MGWANFKGRFAGLGDFLGRVVTIWTLVGGVLSYLVKHSKPWRDHGWGWADAILAGVGLATLLGFMLALGMLVFAVAWRRLRPTQQNEPMPAATPFATPAREERLDDIEATARQLHSKFETVTTNLRVDLGKAVEVGAQALKTAERAEGMADGFLARADEHRHLLQVLLLARDAMGHRVILDSLERQAEPIQSSLYFPEGKGIGAVDWADWIRREQQWRTTIRLWANTAHIYYPNAMKAVERTEQQSYYGSWSFDEKLLPDADTVHRYKTFCIMRKNFGAVREEVASAVWKTAYG